MQVVNGLFNVKLGEYDPLPFNLFEQGVLYVEIVVEGEALDSRQRLLPVPYAMSAQMLGGKLSDYYVSTTAVTQAIDGQKYFMEGVAVGTTTVSSNTVLTVQGNMSLQGFYTPRIMGSVKDWGLMGGPTGVKVRGNYAYIACAWDEFAIVDVSNPTSPVIVGHLEEEVPEYLDSCQYVDLQGRYAYITSKDSNRLTIVDVSIATNPVFVGSVRDDAYLVGATGVNIAGRYAYVTTYDSGMNNMAIVDISDPFESICCRQC